MLDVVRDHTLIVLHQQGKEQQFVGSAVAGNQVVRGSVVQMFLRITVFTKRARIVVFLP